MPPVRHSADSRNRDLIASQRKAEDLQHKLTGVELELKRAREDNEADQSEWAAEKAQLQERHEADRSKWAAEKAAMQELHEAERAQWEQHLRDSVPQTSSVKEELMADAVGTEENPFEM